MANSRKNHQQMTDNATAIKAVLLRLTKLDETGKPIEEPIIFTASKFEIRKKTNDRDNT